MRTLLRVASAAEAEAIVALVAAAEAYRDGSKEALGALKVAARAYPRISRPVTTAHALDHRHHVPSVEVCLQESLDRLAAR